MKKNDIEMDWLLTILGGIVVFLLIWQVTLL